MVRVGLTGGIASGKSTVSELLASHGAFIVDADAISRQSTAAGGAAIDAIRKEFGPACISPEGALDRRLMRELVFSDPSARHRLEAIVHPIVAQETNRLSQVALAQDRVCIVYDVPLLIESAHWRARVDSICVIDCEVGVQIKRGCRRDGLDRLTIEKIIASQTPRQSRLRAADIVLCNTSLSLEKLASEVGEIAHVFGL